MSDIDLNAPEIQEAIQAAAEKTYKERVAGLEANRDKALGQLKELQSKLPEDFDPEEWKKLKAANAEAEEARAREEGRYEELLEKERKRFQKSVEERDAKVASLEASLRKTLIESAAKSAISKHGGDAELLLPHVTNAADLVELNGQHVAVVKDANGEPMLAPEAKTATDYMGIDHLVSGWKEQGRFPGAFVGTGASGGGASANGSGGGATGTKKTISPDELHKYVEEVAKGEVVVAID